MKILTISHEEKLWKGEDQPLLFSAVIWLLFAVGNASFSILCAYFKTGALLTSSAVRLISFRNDHPSGL